MHTSPIARRLNEYMETAAPVTNSHIGQRTLDAIHASGFNGVMVKVRRRKRGGYTVQVRFYKAFNVTKIFALRARLRQHFELSKWVSFKAEINPEGSKPNIVYTFVVRRVKPVNAK